MSNFRRFAFVALAFFVVAPPALASDPPTGAVSLGTFDLADRDPPTEVGIEVRLRPFQLGPIALAPVVGATATGDDGLWGYGGVRHDLELSARWILAPSFAVALFDEGDGKDLGGPVEFRSGLELAYRLRGGNRLGFVFYHLSNAGIYERNPGANSFALTFAFGR